MNQIVVDKELREKLLQSQFVELVDDTGKVLGSFMPFEPRPVDPSQIPPMTEKERRRLYAEPGIYTTEQILEHFEGVES